MKSVSKIFLCGFSSIALSCAVGPLVNHETARTVGQNKHEFLGGYGVAGYVVKWNYGMKENLDLGFQYESLSIGLKLKYSFINAQEGFSLASAVGTGWSAGGSHYYLDGMGSYKTERFEPYATIRFVHVKNDRLEVINPGAPFFTIQKSEYDYGQFLLGARVPFSERAFVSAEVSTLFSLGSGVITGGGLLYGIAIGARTK